MIPIILELCDIVALREQLPRSVWLKVGRPVTVTCLLVCQLSKFFLLFYEFMEYTTLITSNIISVLQKPQSAGPYISRQKPYLQKKIV